MYWQDHPGTSSSPSYTCPDISSQFMSRAAIFSFLPILTKILPESITNIERGRYYRLVQTLGKVSHPPKKSQFRNRFHEITEKWIREHRQEYRGNRAGDIQDAYLEKINSGEEHFSSEVRLHSQIHWWIVWHNFQIFSSPTKMFPKVQEHNSWEN